MCSKEDIKKSLASLMRLKGHDIKSDNIGATVDYFFSILGDMPAEVLDAATLHYLSTATWFPTPGNLRESAISLQMLALGVPEPAEAWAEVISPVVGIVSCLCEEEIRLQENCEGKLGGEYGKAVRLYGEHRDNCELCVSGGFKKIYSHPAIAQTVERLGGRDAIMTTTSMEAADRARFLDAYKAIIAKERVLAGMPQKVRGFVEARNQELIGSGAMKQIGMLSERMSR